MNVIYELKQIYCCYLITEDHTKFLNTTGQRSKDYTMLTQSYQPPPLPTDDKNKYSYQVFLVNTNDDNDTWDPWISHYNLVNGVKFDRATRHSISKIITNPTPQLSIPPDKKNNKYEISSSGTSELLRQWWDTDIYENIEDIKLSFNDTVEIKFIYQEVPYFLQIFKKDLDKSKSGLVKSSLRIQFNSIFDSNKRRQNNIEDTIINYNLFEYTKINKISEYNLMTESITYINSNGKSIVKSFRNILEDGAKQEGINLGYNFNSTGSYYTNPNYFTGLKDISFSYITQMFHNPVCYATMLVPWGYMGHKAKIYNIIPRDATDTNDETYNNDLKKQSQIEFEHIAHFWQMLLYIGIPSKITEKALNSLKEDLKVNFDPDEQYEKIKEICRVAYDISYGLYNQFKWHLNIITFDLTYDDNSAKINVTMTDENKELYKELIREVWIGTFGGPPGNNPQFNKFRHTSSAKQCLTSCNVFYQPELKQTLEYFNSSNGQFNKVNTVFNDPNKIETIINTSLEYMTTRVKLLEDLMNNYDGGYLKLHILLGAINTYVVKYIKSYYNKLIPSTATGPSAPPISKFFETFGDDYFIYLKEYFPTRNIRQKRNTQQGQQGGSNPQSIIETFKEKLARFDDNTFSNDMNEIFWRSIDSQYYLFNQRNKLSRNKPQNIYQRQQVRNQRNYRNSIKQKNTEKEYEIEYELGGGSKKKKKPQLKKKTEKKHKKKYNGGRTVRTKRTGQNHKRNEKTKKKNKKKKVNKKEKK